MMKKMWFYLSLCIIIIIVVGIYWFKSKSQSLENISSQIQSINNSANSNPNYNSSFVDSALVSDNFFLGVTNWFVNDKIYGMPLFVTRKDRQVRSVNVEKWFLDPSKVFYLGWGSKKIGMLRFKEGGFDNAIFSIKFICDTIPGKYLPIQKHLFAIATTDSNLFSDINLRRKSTIEETDKALELSKAYFNLKGRNLKSVDQIKIEQLESLEIPNISKNPIIVGSFSYRNDNSSPAIFDNLFLIAENNYQNYDTTYTVYNKCDDCFKHDIYEFTDTKFLDVCDYNKDGQWELVVELKWYEHSAIHILKKQNAHWQIVLNTSFADE